MAGTLPIGLVLALAAGCSTGGKTAAEAAAAAASAAAPPTVVVEAPARAAIVVAGSQSGAQVVLHRPQRLQVELATDVGAVSGGYEWMLGSNDPALLTPGAPVFERASRDVNAFESAGTTIWRFTPLAAGRTTLEFALRRPRTLDAPAATVRFEVVVR